MPDQRAIEALHQTRQTWFRRLGSLLQQPSLNEGLWRELEEILIGADVGVETTLDLLKRLRERLGRGQTHRLQEATEGLRQELVSMLEVEGTGERGGLWADSKKVRPSSEARSDPRCRSQWGGKDNKCCQVSQHLQK